MLKTQHSKKYRKLLEVIRSSRKASKMTQEEVSKRLGTYSTFITKIEAGERRLDVVELAALCEIYKTSLHSILKAAGIS